MKITISFSSSEGKPVEVKYKPPTGFRYSREALERLLKWLDNYGAFITPDFTATLEFDTNNLKDISLTADPSHLGALLRICLTTYGELRKMPEMPKPTSKYPQIP